MNYPLRLFCDPAFHYLTRDRGFALTEQPPGVIDQKQVTAQREAFQHPFPRRIQPAPVLNRTEPVRFLQPCRCVRSGNAAALGRFQVLGPALGVDVIDALLDRGVCTRLRNLGNPRRHRVEINIGAGRQKRFFIEDGDALEASLKERPNTIPLNSQLADLRPIG
ncbi:MAG: hypothetical protein ACLQVF_46815 [Isosphaeraceae bacterium]